MNPVEYDKPTSGGTDLTIVALSAQSWSTCYRRNTARRAHVGSCKNPALLPFSKLASFLQSGDNHNLSLLEEVSNQISVHYCISNGIKPDEVEGILPDGVYSYGLKSLSGMEKEEAAKISKAHLPAIVPSVIFDPSYSYADMSPKKAVSYYGESWKHTGVFGFDIDLGKDGNTDDADELYDMGVSFFSTLPGFLLLFRSPSGGLKVLIQVDGATRVRLNEGSNEGRIALHKAIYKRISEGINESAPFVLDSRTNDVARIQYLYREPGYVYVPSELDSNGTYSGLGHWDARDIYAEKDADSLHLLDEENRKALPSSLLGFISYLHDTGYVSYAEHLEGNLVGYADGFKCSCPCCIEEAGGQIGNTDLWFIPGDGDMNTWRVTCFHESCKTGKGTKTGKDITSMAELYRGYESYLSEKVSNLTSEAVASAKEKEKEPEEGEENIAFDYMRDYITSLLQSNSKTRYRVNPPYSTEQILEGAKPWAGKLIMEEYTVKSKGRPKKGEEGEEGGEKKERPAICRENLEIILAECFDIFVTYNTVSQEYWAIDTKNRYVSNCYSIDQFRKPLAYAVHEFVYKPFGVAYGMVDVELERALPVIGNSHYFNPFLKMIEYDDWDGKEDRVGRFIDILISAVDPSWSLDGGSGELLNKIKADIARDPKGAEKIGLTEALVDPKEYTREVMKTFLVCAYRKYIHGCEPHMYTKAEEHDNMCPVIYGEQGVGKNTLIESLVTVLGEGYLWNPSGLRDISGDNKDNNMKASSCLIAHLDEVDKYTEGEEAISTLKQVITSKTNKIRLPFARHLQDLPVKVSYIGSTNKSAFLLDASGNRRFATIITKGGYNMNEIQWLRATNIWPQVKRMAEEDENVGRYGWYKLQKITEHNNSTNVMSEGTDVALLELLVDASDIMDTKGHILLRHVSQEFSNYTTILETLRSMQGSTKRVTRNDVMRFTNDIIKKYELSDRSDLYKRVRKTLSGKRPGSTISKVVNQPSFIPAFLYEEMVAEGLAPRIR